MKRSDFSNHRSAQKKTAPLLPGEDGANMVASNKHSQEAENAYVQIKKRSR